MDELLAEKVLRAVEQIPPGRVASYGDIAGIVGIGPRHVGNVLKRYEGVCWWRVVNAAGRFAPPLAALARPHWEAEGIDTLPDGLGCRIEHYRADLTRLERAYRRAVADLPASTGAGGPVSA